MIQSYKKLIDEYYDIISRPNWYDNIILPKMYKMLDKMSEKQIEICINYCEEKYLKLICK